MLHPLTINTQIIEALTSTYLNGMKDVEKALILFNMFDLKDLQGFNSSSGYYNMIVEQACHDIVTPFSTITVAYAEYQALTLSYMNISQ